MIIEPDGMSIKKNQLQELQDQFSMKPVYSKYNSYVIMNAELMNASSANSILKFLEEPTDHIIGFLVTNNKEKMLDTIISRCQNLKFIYDDKSKSDEKINIIANEYPVGKKLDFLSQEIHRELNTIASKSSKQEIIATVVESKAESDRIREQIQNII